MRKIRNRRIELWAHLVSEHAMCIGLNYDMAEYTEIHNHEHKGPGTIRNHPKGSRAYSFKSIGSVLSEQEGTEFDKKGIDP